MVWGFWVVIFLSNFKTIFIDIPSYICSHTPFSDVVALPYCNFLNHQFLKYPQNFFPLASGLTTCIPRHHFKECIRLSWEWIWPAPSDLAQIHLGAFSIFSIVVRGNRLCTAQSSWDMKLYKSWLAVLTVNPAHLCRLGTCLIKLALF